MDKILIHKVELWSRLRISYWLVHVKRKIKGNGKETVPGSSKGKNMGQEFAGCPCEGLAPLSPVRGGWGEFKEQDARPF